MMTLRSLFVAVLVVCLAFAAPAFAQQRHVVDPAILSQTVDQHASVQDAQRAAIRQALARPQVQDVARQFGVDLERINASVATLSNAELARAAAAAGRVNDTLAGGASNLVISTTTLIIVLLVVILIVVAVK